MEYPALLELLLNLHSAGSVESDEILLYLQQFKEGFLKLLDFKGPSAESRRQVQSRKVTTAKYGAQELDLVPDVQHALLLSDELRLDEVLCVEYLTSALEERGVFGAEFAAGLYLEERQVALRCLARLLAEDARTQQSAQHHTAGGGPAGARTPHAQAIAAYVSELLGEKDAGGRQVLVSRLIAILRDTSLEPRPGTALPLVRDEAGNPVARGLLLQRERREAARCLLYAVARDPALAPAVAGELLELLAGLLSRMSGTGSGDLFLVEEAHLVLLAGCSVLVPHEGRHHQNSALQELVNATRSKVESVGQAGYGAALRLCWGLLALSSGAAPQDGCHWVREALKAGALAFMRQLFQHPHFKLDDSTHAHVVAAAVHHILATLLRTDAERAAGAFYQQLLQRSEAAIRPTPGPGHGGAVLAYAPFPPESPEARADQLGSLLGLLADCFEAYPDLYLSNLADQEAGARPVKELLERAINSPVMRSSPEVRVPLLQLLAALAGSERGVHLVLRQMDAMATVPALEVLTLRKLFHTVLAYCLRFFATTSEIQRQQQLQLQGGMGAAGLQAGSSSLLSAYESIVNPYEADILVAFLQLLKRVLENGRPGEVAAFWAASSADLAPSLNGFPLQEPLFQLMCYPVQNSVKAALDEVLGALAAALPDLAPRLLERLLQCTVVKAPAAVLPTVPRLDIVQQLNEVEARREEYPETLALIRLLNALLGPLAAPPGGRGGAAGGGGGGGGGAGLPDGGADVTSFTLFIQQHVLGHLWTRGYRIAAQKWEVAAAAFAHLEQVVQLASRPGLPPPLPASEAAATGAKQPPGYLVMHDLLGGGPAYAALLHVLSPGYASALTALAGDSDEVGAREAAVLSGLRLLNAALRLDGPFVESLAATNLSNRYQPLHQKLLSGGVRQLATLLQYVCYPDSADIQVEAIRLALELSARLPHLVELLSTAGAGGGAGGAGAAAGVPFISAAAAAGSVGAAASAAAVAAAAAAEDLSDVLGSLRRGFAQAMAAGAACPDALDNLDAPPSERLGPYGGSPSGDSPPDPRAALVLRLMLSNSAPALPVPSFAHLLLGYDMECALGGRLDESLLLPHQEYSCLTIIERLLTQHEMRLALTKPKLYSQCLCLLHRAAASPSGGLPMLEWLSPKNNPLIPSLRGLLTLELPGAAHGAHGGLAGMVVGEAAEALRPHELSAALHSRSWYMRITGLLLLRLQHEESSRQLLAELFAPPGAPALPTDPHHAAAAANGNGLYGNGGGYSAVSSSVAGTSTLLDTMRAASGLAFPEPQLSDLTQEQRRMLQDLSAGEAPPLEQLLTNPALMSAAGVAMASDTGDLLFSVDALFGLLRRRLDAYAARAGGVAGLGGAAEAGADAARAALRHAAAHNAYVLLAGAQAAAVEAWQQLVQVVFTRSYELLSGLLRGGAAEALYEVLVAALEAVRRLMGRHDGAAERAAGPLCSAARVLLSKLQEQSILHVSLGQASDPLAAVRVPSRCQALLRLLVDLIRAAHVRRTPAVRLQLYAATLQYLQLSRGSKLATSCAPPVLAALLQGWGTPAEAVAVLDQSEELIERANAAVVAEAGPGLVEALAADALNGSAPPLGQAVSLHLLRALLAVDSAHYGASSASSASGSGAAAAAAMAASVAAAAAAAGSAGAVVAAAAYAQGVPQQLLGQLAALPPSALTAAGKRARRSVHVLEAALALLAALAAAGPPAARAAAAQQLYSLNALTALNRCSALDVVPDDPTTAQLRPGLSGAAGSSATTDGVRYRLNALAAPLLRLLLSVLAALPDSPAVCADAAAFAAAHHGLLCRAMGDAAASGSRGGWVPGDSELELADLALGLLVRLVPALAGLPPLVAEQLKAMAYKLAFAFCCQEERSASPIVQSLRAARREASSAAAGAGAPHHHHANGNGSGSSAMVIASDAGAAAAAAGTGLGGGGGGGAGAAGEAASRGARVMSVRCSLARLLRDMAAAAVAAPGAAQSAAAAAANGGSGAAAAAPSGLLRAVGPPERREMDPLTGRPTLQLVRDMAQQACHDASASLDELCELLALLRLPDSHLDEATVSARLRAYAPPGSATVAAAVAAGASAAGLAARRRLARHFWALAATALDRQLSRALFVLEAGLSTIAIHFLRCLPRPGGSAAAAAGKDAAAAGSSSSFMDTSGGADELLAAAAGAGSLGLGLDLAALGGLPAPGEAEARQLGSPEELSNFMVQLQDTCRHAEELLTRLTDAAAEAGGGSGAGLPLGGLAAGGGRGGAAGAGSGWGSSLDAFGAASQPQQQPVEGIDLMVRALKMYCSRS
ncbi:hypothetical protein HYH02_010705 [Chlamydomonas schloesseri]|uniref:Uncharacterized protein n=1 Tax=Chlamydomonas schloesseri TaxID=2026947 RepID=A0A835W4C7_9CHLO|nr:hypothetical protein HYH02_010705 [Chlamydomonas schloesseri]|eukprot:KAG2438910.1 hypothetical protein HYH02_010705 [Chlamydomonas schloesseri]